MPQQEWSLICEQSKQSTLMVGQIFIESMGNEDLGRNSGYGVRLDASVLFQNQSGTL
jgi:hypothetical protein